MKKQAFIYLSGLVLSTLIGIAIGRSSKKVLKSSAILNVVCDDIRKTASLSLELGSDKDIWKLSQSKVAVFDIRVTKVEKKKDEEPSHENA